MKVMICQVFLSFVCAEARNIFISTEAMDVHKYALNFMPFTQYEDQRWTLVVSTDVYGSNFIAFFASDNNRPLTYSCAYTTALCDFSIIKTTPDPQKHEATIFGFFKNLYLPAPAMSGRLMICVAQRNMFWKRPLMTSKNYFCLRINPSLLMGERFFKIPPTQAMPCLNGSSSIFCNTDYLIRPEPRVIEKTELDIYTWYMTKRNYREMRQGKLTKVIVPLFKTRYRFYIYGSLGNPNNWTCTFQKPGSFSAGYSLKAYDKNLDLVRHPITAAKSNSGVYSITCSSVYHDSIQSLSHRISMTKSLNIVFIRGPMITIEGQTDYTVYFSPWTSSSHILVSVHTTSSISSFKITREPNITLPDTIFASSVSNSPYEIIWTYNITLALLDYDTNGVYEILVLNADWETAIQQFTIMKAKALKVLVSPRQIEVEDGSSCKFLCYALGNLVDSIKWARDFEELDRTKYNFETDVTFGGEGRSLTINKATLEYSGIYECTASNRFQTVTESVKLIVWPKGSPYLPKSIVKSPVRLPSGPNVLNITDEEIEKEYNKIKLDKSQNNQNPLIIHWKIVAGVASGLVAGIMVICVLVCVVVIRRQSPSPRKRKKEVQWRKESDEDIDETAHLLHDRRASTHHTQGLEEDSLLACKEDSCSDTGVETESMMENLLEEDSFSDREVQDTMELDSADLRSTTDSEKSVTQTKEVSRKEKEIFDARERREMDDESANEDLREKSTRKDRSGKREKITGTRSRNVDRNEEGEKKRSRKENTPHKTGGKESKNRAKKKAK